MPALILIEDPAEGVRLLTFNRPEKLNALSSAMLDELEAALDAASRDGSLRCLVLTGAGDKAFVAGADIGEYAEHDFERFVSYQRRSRDLFSRLERVEVPTVVALNGYALGGGFEIALCCDILIASENTQVGLPEGLLGLSPGGGGTQRLVRAVGKYAASDVLLAGRRLKAERARELGLVSEVVPLDRLREAALEKASQIAKIGPLAAREMKRLMREGPDSSLESSLSLEQDALARLYHSQDSAEGIRAFTEKRAAAFTGR